MTFSRETVSGFRGRLLLASALLLAWTVPAVLAAEREPVVRAAEAGEWVSTPVGAAEALRLEPGVAAALLDLAPERAIAMDGWPVAAGERHRVELARFEVYAPDARILEVRGDRLVELPRSRLSFFHGRSVDDPETRLMVTVDPDSRSLTALAATSGRLSELRPRGGEAGGHLVASAEAFLPEEAETSWGCAQETTELERLWLPSSNLQPAIGAAITSLHTATIAVDTDNELMSLKFGNDTAAATNYIANLIARMNVMYERDLLIRLVQGFTLLRPSTTADPYTAGTSTVDGLYEFANHWRGGCGGACSGVSRALAMMLSGKSSSNFSAAGVAWVDALCSATYGYSFSQVFKFAQDTSSSDGKLVGHELGHNFGSPHTHCYSPAVDTCYNSEGGCYSGGTSCPAPKTYNGVTNVTGTVMSYCHLTGCGSTEVFHPTVVSTLQPKIQNRVAQCVFPLGPANAIFSDGFESGTKGAWQ
jgi:hypothetical protein